MVWSSCHFSRSRLVVSSEEEGALLLSEGTNVVPPSEGDVVWSVLSTSDSVLDAILNN